MKIIVSDLRLCPNGFHSICRGVIHHARGRNELRPYNYHPHVV
jgi:hypothetical protein